jgi:hypothetical protein
MAIFAIIPTPGAADPRLGAEIARRFGQSHVAIDGGHGWLVSAKDTAPGLSDSLGISDGTNGSAIVFEVSSYFGRANPNIWTWIKLNWDSR